MFSTDIVDSNSISGVADWVELVVALNKQPMAKAEVSSKIEGAIGDEPSDSFLSDVWDELDTRMNYYGVHPPFIVEPLDIVPNIDWEENPEYPMCLILALTGNPSNPTPTGKLFERICREAIKNYLNGEAIVFGFPSPHTVQSICDLTYEIFKRNLPANFKDRGLDVLGWKPFGDKRGNQVIILMQCAGGLNWYTKTGDIVQRAWTEKYMTFGCTPVRGFSTAIAITDTEMFEEVSFETDLLFDRPRIINNVLSFELEGNLRTEILDWCKNRIQEISN